MGYRRHILLLFTIFSNIPSFAQLDNARIHDLKEGRVIHDTSYIYWLPYEPGKKFFLIQGWQSQYSHKGELSLDFKMKSGNKVYAAREGIVTDVKEDSDRGGMGNEYLNDGNHIVILHSDGYYGGYWHLQKDGAFVNVGDTVKKGQLIGLSGNTGYSAFPHLHFWVYKKGDSLQTIPTRFQLRKDIRYLKPGQFYRSVHGN